MSMILANQVKEVTTQFAAILGEHLSMIGENLSTIKKEAGQTMLNQASDYGLQLQELNSSRVTPGA